MGVAEGGWWVMRVKKGVERKKVSRTGKKNA
jgi:hypothetical protein